MTRRRGILTLLVGVLAFVLAACSGLPTSGKVNYGLSTSDAPDSDDVSFLLPDSPQPGATPEQIVEGFIRAGSGPGARARWDRAREFLTPEFAGVWDPGAGVTVDEFEDRVYTQPEEGLVALTLNAVGTVDDNGTYERVEIPERQLPFELEQVDGEWRIRVAPDGVVLDRAQFPRVFHNYSLMYFDPSWQFLVPDARWFPTTDAPSQIADQLVNGAPSAWLAESVKTAVPEGVAMVAAVRQQGDAYDVDLSASALSADAATLDRVYTQLQASLATAGVSDVELTVQSAPIAAEPVAVRSTRIPGAPLVLTEDGFGFLTGEELEPIEGLSGIVEQLAPAAVQVGADRTTAAAHLTSGEVVRLLDDGRYQVLDSREGIVDPTIDPFGTVWSVPRDQPAAVHVFLAGDTTPLDVADAFAGATAVHAVSVSRDGARIAALVTAGGRTALWVAGVVRDPDQVPIRLGAPVQLSLVDGRSRGLAWLDDLSVGVLSGDAEGSTVLEQVVGGTSSAQSAPADMVEIAGGTTLSSVRLRGEDGTLSVKRGTTWQPTASGVLMLATQQGTPE